jgi:hypothetical protein
MRRRRLTIAAAVSLLLCAAAVVPWVRSRGGDGAQFTWGRGVETGYGYAAANEVRYYGGTVFYSRVRPPVVSLGGRSGGEGVGRPDEVDVLGLHVRRGHWMIVPDGDVAPHRLVVWFPGWWPAALAGVVPISWLWLCVRDRRRRRPGCCAACGYDLRATPERCPECGAVARVEVA